MDICPENTLYLIENLEKGGFLDSHFQLIHHWGKIKGKDSSLKSHKIYLSKSKSNYRIPGNNFEVAVKLKACLDQANLTSKRPNFFKICNSVNSDNQ